MEAARARPSLTVLGKRHQIILPTVKSLKLARSIIVVLDSWTAHASALETAPWLAEHRIYHVGAGLVNFGVG